MKTTTRWISKGVLLTVSSALALLLNASAAVSLDEALDAVGLVWSSTNANIFLGQSSVTHDGVDAAESPAIGSNTAAMCQTPVSGPGTFSFWWKVSSETNNDRLLFYIDGVEQARITGEVDWQQRTFNLPAGTHLLRFAYSKNVSINAGEDRGWIDEVQYVANPNCTFAISPGNASYSSGAVTATGSVTVTASPGCLWAAVPSNSWISILSGTNGTGDGTVVYIVAANTSTSARDGSISIAGRPFFISQAGVPPIAPTILAQPTNRTVTVGGTANFRVIVGGTPPFFYRWLVNEATVTNGSGVSGATTSNLFLSNVQLSRAGTYRVVITNSAGLALSSNAVLTVIDNGGGTNGTGGCTIAISPPLRYHSWEYGTSYVSVAVPPGCSWGVINTNPWINYATGVGTFESFVSYSVAENTTSFMRTGIMVIGEQIYTVVQNPNWSCSFTFSPDSASHGAGAVTGSVAVAATAPGGCNWFPSTSNSWITIVSGFSNSGSATVTYALAANAGPFTRYGGIRVANQFFPISQAGTGSTGNCTFAVSPTNFVLGSGSVTGLVTVTAPEGCAWLTWQTNAWIAILAGAEGSGSGVVRFRTTENPTPISRSGQLFIANQLVTVTQSGLPGNECGLAISPASASFGSGSVTGVVNVITPDGCPWSAGTTNSWITLYSSGTNSGSGSVLYSVAPNNTTVSRSGGIRVNQFTFVISQSASNSICTFALSPSNAVFGAAQATGVVSVTTGSNCTWLVFNSNSWITVFSPSNRIGSGTVDFMVAANPNSWSRSGNIRIGTRLLLVTQSGDGTNVPPCTYSISPTNRVHGYGAASNFVTVTAPAGCPWGVINTNPWVTITAGAENNTGSGIVGYLVSANSEPVVRSGYIRIADRLFSITQNPGPGATNSCLLILTPSSRFHDSGSSTGQIEVGFSSPNCAWAASETNSWITLLSGTNGVGNGVVVYAVAPNPGNASRLGVIRIGNLNFTISQDGTPLPPSIPVAIPPIQVTNIGHAFAPNPLPFTNGGFGYAVVDYLIDQDQSSGGGALLPNVAINWDTNHQFTVTVAAPPGMKFVVEVPPGRRVGFGGYLWWESTRGGFSPAGTASARFENLEGRAPEFSGASPVLSDSHGFFGFADLEGNTVSNRFAFTALTLTGNVTPQVTGNGTESYVPHLESALQISYTSAQTNDPGRFVFLVPTVGFTGIQPALDIKVNAEGDLTVMFSGVLQWATAFDGPYEDVPGNPTETFTIPKANLNTQYYFRAKSQ